MVKRASFGPALIVTIITVLFVALGAFAIAFVPNVILANWFPNLSDDERRQSLAPAAQIVLFSLGGVIAVVGVALSILRHREELAAADRDMQRRDLELQRREDDLAREHSRQHELAEQRHIEAERELRDRFVTTVDLLSATEPIKRTAALYALAALADDWDSQGRRDEAQVCVDVLCAYLRSPISASEARTPADEAEVRMTGYALIADHTREEATHSWSDKILQLRGALVDFPVAMERTQISGGSLEFNEATIGDGGYIDLRGSLVTNGGHIAAWGARFVGGELTLRETVVEEDARIDISHSLLTGNAKVDLTELALNDGVLLAGCLQCSGDGALLAVGMALTGKSEAYFDHSFLHQSSVVDIHGSTVQGSSRLVADSLLVADDSVLDATGVSAGGTGLVRIQNVSVNSARTWDPAFAPTAGGTVIGPDGTRHGPTGAVESSAT